jgi:hypothetical protein
VHPPFDRSWTVRCALGPHGHGTHALAASPHPAIPHPPSLFPRPAQTRERERVPAAIPHRTCGLRCWPAVNNRPASRRRCSRNCRSLAVSPSDRSLLYIAQPLRRLSTASPTATRCEDRDGRVMAVQARRTLIPHTPSPSAPSFRNTSIGLGHFNSKRFHVCVPAG